MTNRELDPLYTAYKEFVQRIVDSKIYKEYAEGEIEAFNQQLLRNFQSISAQIIDQKEWNKS